jgi:hypothetical protein
MHTQSSDWFEVLSAAQSNLEPMHLSPRGQAFLSNFQGERNLAIGVVDDEWLKRHDSNATY